MKVVIIGGGSAGTTCAFELRKLDKDADITVLESSAHTEYSPCALPYVLSGEIDDFSDIFIFEKKDYESNGIDLQLSSEVVDIDRENKIIHYRNGGQDRSVRYDHAIIATGSMPFIPPIKGLDEASYRVLKSIDDAKSIYADIKEGLTSAVIGGGLIGVEVAMALSQRNEKVVLVEAKDNIFSSLLDPKMSNILKDHLEGLGMTILEGRTIQQISQNGMDLGNERIGFDKLFVCTGVKADTRLAEKAGLKVNEGIKADGFMVTSDASIFACGDCVESVQAVSEKKSLSQLGTTAVRQAKVIANNIIAQNKMRFPPVLNNTVTRIGDMFVASVGLTLQRCKELDIAAISSRYAGGLRSDYYPSDSRITITLVCKKDDGRIIGAQMIGNEDVVGRIDLIALAIQEKCSVKSLAELETCYNPASAPIFDPLTIAANIAVKKLKRLEGP